jgi:hypothetical protein
MGRADAIARWPRRLAERWDLALLHLLAVLPALFLLHAIHRNAVDVPFMDDWQFVSLVEQVRGGAIPWREFTAPHDEHRLLIPRIVIVASVILSHGNYRVQCFVTFGVVAALSLALLWLLRRTFGTGRATPWVWLLANVILFSPIQWHNWLWPMQFCYFLPFAFLGFALVAWYSDLSLRWRFGLAQLCAWAGSFSFVHGLLIWPVMLPVLLRDRRWDSARARRVFGAAWLLAALLAFILYFDGLSRNAADPAYAYLHKGVPPTTSTLRLLREQPLDTLERMARFALAMFGNAVARGFPASSNLRLATVGGSALLALGAALWVALARRRRLAGPAFAWVALLVHAFLTAAFVAVGRVWAGPGQPLTPRYATYGTFCVLAVGVLACLWIAEAVRSQAGRERAFMALGAGMTVLAVNWAYGLNLMGEWRDVQTTSRSAVHFSQRLKVPSLRLAGGRRKFLRKRIAALDRLGYWNPPLAASLRLDQFEIAPELTHKEGHVNGVRSRPDGSFEIRGRARFGSAGRTPDAILVTSADAEGVPTIRSLCETRSPPRWERHARMRDYEFVDRAWKRFYGSFRCRIDPAKTPVGGSPELTLWALDFGRSRVHRIPGQVTLPAAAAAAS